MTKEQYHLLAPTFNRTQHLIDLEIDRIPFNVNRAGKTYRRLTKQIRERYKLIK